MTATWMVKGIYKADAQKVAEELGDRDWTAKEIVEAARDENSAMHDCFEWDDSKAAAKYREHQAQIMLSMLRVVRNDVPGAEPVRLFSLTTEKGIYRPTKVMLTQPDEYECLLRRAKAEAECFKKKYETLSELEQVVEAIDMFLSA